MLLLWSFRNGLALADVYVISSATPMTPKYLQGLGTDSHTHQGPDPDRSLPLGSVPPCIARTVLCNTVTSKGLKSLTKIRERSDDCRPSASLAILSLGVIPAQFKGKV